MIEQKSIGRDAAIALAGTKWWEGKTAREIAVVGTAIRELCLPFDVLHKAVEETLARPVWSHEFGTERLYQELAGEIPAPSVADILMVLPAEKRVLVVAT